MSDIEKIIEAETEASENDRDAPIPEGAKIGRPNRGRSTVYSIRLNPEEVTALQSVADAAGVPGGFNPRPVMDRGTNPTRTGRA